MLSHIVENWGSWDKGKEERRKKKPSLVSPFFIKSNDFPPAKKSKAA